MYAGHNLQLCGEPFTWGRQELVSATRTRKAYIAALRAANAGDIQPLLAFARS